MTWHKAAIIAAVLSGVLFALPAKSQDIEAVQLYSDAELVEMFATNEHITQVRDVDRCQLAQDIEAQAELERRPTYQFLYGDMKAWGICYDRDPKIGLLYMEKAAEQGLVEALEQLGRYYHEGRLVQQDIEPYDYENAYHWLHNSVTGDSGKHREIQQQLAQLSDRMPPSVVEKAKRPLE